MNDSNTLLAVEMRVGILFTRLTMRCPARVSDRKIELKGAFYNSLFQRADLACLLARLDLTVLDPCNARGVVASILEKF